MKKEGIAVCEQKKERLSKGGVLMKGRRKISLIVAAALVVGSGVVGLSNLSQAYLSPTQEEVIIDNSSTCQSNVWKAYSKQALSASGAVVVPKYVGGSEDDAITGKMETVYDNTSEMTMSFTLNGGYFQGSTIGLLIDNGTGTACIEATANGNSVTFTVDNGSIYKLGSDIKHWAIVNGDVCQNTTIFNDTTNDGDPLADSSSINGVSGKYLGIKISGTLETGDKVVLSLTSKLNGQTFDKGCMNVPLYVIENQWVAHRCQCCQGNEEGVDVDKLTYYKGGVTVEDTIRGKDYIGYDIYNACDNATITSTGECCPTANPECSLFCQKTSGTSSTYYCSEPGFCNEDELCDNPKYGLKIYTAKDFASKSEPSYRVQDLNGATVKFTLEDAQGQLEKVKAIYIVNADDPDKTLGQFDIVDNKTATVEISGGTLFTSENGGMETGNQNAPIRFTVKIVPKDGVVLDPDEFNLSATISGGDVKNEANLNWGTFLEWAYATKGITVFKVPYIRQDSQVTSVIRFENAGTTPINVSLYVNDPNGSGWTYVENVVVDPGTSKAVLGSDLINEAKARGITLDGTKGFAVKGITDANQDYLTIYASQEDTSIGSFRPLPVKILDANYQE